MNLNPQSNTYNYPVLIAPGYGNSGKNHWQTLWQNENPEFIRIEQNNWLEPNADEWISSIEESVSAIGSGCVIVAHSLACVALIIWANKTKLKIKGALLIAPADSESSEFKLKADGFSQIPKKQLPFKSIVISSSNDQFCSAERAQFFASQWGSQFFNLGELGHINAESNIGAWNEGRQFLTIIGESN
ncbi:MAG: alpha/beta hydrolase [Bacteroidales bacterium]|nr:alpha/beta hydrolase [Bacteroidales bacterium]